MPDKSYWFYLDPHVYLEIRGAYIFLYNCLTGGYLQYRDHKSAADFLRRLEQKENLYVLRVTDTELMDNHLEEVVQAIRSEFMGDLSDISLTPKKPFIMPAQMDIRETSEPLPARTVKNVSKDSFLALKELTIYVTGQCTGNCKSCNNASKQFTWCAEATDNGELELSEIEEILRQTKACPIQTVNILGGDPLRYSRLKDLAELLNSRSFQVNYYFHLNHVRDGFPEFLRDGSSRARVILLVDCSTLVTLRDLDTIKQLKADRLVFLLQDEEEIAALETLMGHLNTGNISVQPFFNGDNLDFFRANVFTDHESLRENLLSMSDIRARKSYNLHGYGHMIIKSNKLLYANMNGAPLGRIGEISMEDAVIEELTGRGHWLKTRRDVSPCNICMLNAICPPLSNFEIATGINNSCTIWNSEG